MVYLDINKIALQIYAKSLKSKLQWIMANDIDNSMSVLFEDNMIYRDVKFFYYAA